MIFHPDASLSWGQISKVSVNLPRAISNKRRDPSGLLDKHQLRIAELISPVIRSYTTSAQFLGLT